MENNNFLSKPILVSGNIYKWTDNSQINRTILFDIFSASIRPTPETSNEWINLLLTLEFDSNENTWAFCCNLLEELE